MPGLSLNLAQARRLWGLDHPTCASALGELVESGLLYRTDKGEYVLRTRNSVLPERAQQQARMSYDVVDWQRPDWKRVRSRDELVSALLRSTG